MFDAVLQDNDSCALAPEAGEIWGRCVGCPQPAAGAPLQRYLRHNQLDAGFFFAAYGDSTVADITRALDKRARLTAFALRQPRRLVGNDRLRDQAIEILAQRTGTVARQQGANPSGGGSGRGAIEIAGRARGGGEPVVRGH